MAFGNKGFGRSYFAEPTRSVTPQVPGFTSGYTVGSGAAEAFSVAGAEGTASSVGAGAGEGFSVADGGGSITSIGSAMGEIRDQQGGIPT